MLTFITHIQHPMNENDHMNAILRQHEREQGEPEPETCDFCYEESDYLIRVTDADGVRFTVCRECLKYAEPVCAKCGCGDEPRTEANVTLTCPDCGYNCPEDDYYILADLHSIRAAERAREVIKKGHEGNSRH